MADSHGRLGRLFLWLALLAATGGLLLPLLSGRIVYFDGLAHFRVQFALLMLAAAVALALRRWRWAAFGAILIGGPLAVSLFSYAHLAPAATAPPAAGQIRVMTFNTWGRNRRMDVVVRRIRAHKPDLVAMMEMYPRRVKMQIPRRLGGAYPHFAHCMNTPHCRLGLLSRWPVLEMKGRTRWAGPPYLRAVIATPQGPVTVLVVHTLRFPWVRSQQKQLRALARMIHHLKGPLIVMGDFNATAFSRLLRTFERRSGLRRHTFLPTWPVRPIPLPQLGIDHIFTNDYFTTAAGPWVVAPAGSDHLPVMLVLKRR